VGEGKPYGAEVFCGTVAVVGGFVADAGSGVGDAELQAQSKNSPSDPNNQNFLMAILLK
jgi:hypothetical protein